jgi:hypothetical protein
MDIERPTQTAIPQVVQELTIRVAQGRAEIGKSRNLTSRCRA